MPDLPDDHFEIDTSIFENGGMMTGAFSYFKTREGEDGLSHLERDEQRRQKLWDKMDRKMEAGLQRDFDGMNVPCYHDPECPGDLCKDTIEARKAAEEQYQKTIAEIEAEDAPKKKKTGPTVGPSTIKSKSAAATLSHPKPAAVKSKVAAKTVVPSTKPRPNTSIAFRTKKTPVPTNPSPMRHAAALANSKNTMGYAKGRSASAMLRKTEQSKTDPEVPDTSLAPAEYIQRYGVPRLGSEMWISCKRAGCFEEDEEPSLEEMFGGDGSHSLDKLLREEAEQDFQLTLE